MNFASSVVPSLLRRRRIFFETHQFPQSVLHKSSYIQKYDTKILSSLGKDEKNSQSHSKWCFAKKKILFLHNFYDSSIPKLVLKIRAVSLPFLFYISFAFIPFPFDISAVFVDNPAVTLPSSLDFLFEFDK